MIVIGQNVLLAAQVDPELAPNNPRIGWRNIITEDNVAATSEDTDFPVINVANPTTYQKWHSASDAEQFVTITLDEAETTDYFAVAGHNFGTGEITYQFQASDDGGLTWDDLTDERFQSDDKPIMYHYGEAIYDRYRLRLVPGGTTAPQIAVLYVGQILTLQRRVYVGHSPISLSRDIVVSNGQSENGHFLGRIERRRSLTTEVSLSNLTPAWYREHFDPFAEAAGSTTPFFFAWRPGAYPEEIAYAWLNTPPRPQNSRSNGMMSVSLSLKGLA